MPNGARIACRQHRSSSPRLDRRSGAGAVVGIRRTVEQLMRHPARPHRSVGDDVSAKHGAPIISLVRSPSKPDIRITSAATTQPALDAWTDLAFGVDVIVRGEGRADVLTSCCARSSAAHRCPTWRGCGFVSRAASLHDRPAGDVGRGRTIRPPKRDGRVLPATRCSAEASTSSKPRAGFV